MLTCRGGNLWAQAWQGDEKHQKQEEAKEGYLERGAKVQEFAGTSPAPSSFFSLAIFLCDDWTLLRAYLSPVPPTPHTSDLFRKFLTRPSTTSTRAGYPTMHRSPPLRRVTRRATSALSLAYRASTSAQSQVSTSLRWRHTRHIVRRASRASSRLTRTVI